MWIFPTHCNTRPIAAAGRQQNHSRAVVMTVAAGWTLLTSSAFAQSTSTTGPHVRQLASPCRWWERGPCDDTVHLTARIRL